VHIFLTGFQSRFQLWNMRCSVITSLANLKTFKLIHTWMDVEYVVALATCPSHVIIVGFGCFSLLNIMTWSASFSALALHPSQQQCTVSVDLLLNFECCGIVLFSILIWLLIPLILNRKRRACAFMGAQ
jgi:hypothetical protein